MGKMLLDDADGGGRFEVVGPDPELSVGDEELFAGNVEVFEGPEDVGSYFSDLLVDDAVEGV
jgi:hypothetical protein